MHWRHLLALIMHKPKKVYMTTVSKWNKRMQDLLFLQFLRHFWNWMCQKTDKSSIWCFLTANQSILLSEATDSFLISQKEFLVQTAAKRVYFCRIRRINILYCSFANCAETEMSVLIIFIFVRSSFKSNAMRYFIFQEKNLFISFYTKLFVEYT